ncbi:MAG TPA: translation initiation factor IF-2 [Gammaproteobacteria bacterium]|nr:translation initiation factor IF-2 [Xanthomonadales bacterium]HOP21897.1 translation initiation factor IF-2 [Gammaproteobacteria bacterium]HPI96261.1 translation initiation factor IF-2 [Gammaproteobacteria bacterium]HPQ87145.1 translation initiation factor IF-2 [Gammaproteobacteria bacterium]
MSEVTVKQLAEVLGISLEQLMDQLSGAGISIKSADDTISNEDKRQLLAYLRSAHGKESKDETPKKKVVLKRKSTGTLKISSGTGVRAKTKTVNIEVRKKRIVNKLNKDEMDEIARDRQEALKALEERKKQLAAEETKRIEEEKLRKQEEEEARKAEESIKQQEQEEELVGVEETELEEVEEENDASSDTEEELTEEEQAKAKELQEIEDQVQRQVMAAVEKKKREKENLKKGKHAKKKDDEEEDDDFPKSKNRKKQGKYGREELHVKGGKKGAFAKDFKKPEKHGFTKPVADQVKTVKISSDGITVSELAKDLAIKAGDIIKELMKEGMMVTINHILDQDTAVLVVEELGHQAEIVAEQTLAEELFSEAEEKEDESQAETRPPVVTVMGHVDHGKTSLLDYIRETKVTDKEAGGITQHIGAYHVKTDHGVISFIDTPGHAAFTAMRQRGAQATDIVILVVAANDGVMPQTVEAVKHAKAAGVPIIVAVNKMDLQGASVDKAKKDLTNYEIVPEDWGGDTQFVPVSAKTGMGIEELLEAISLQAEVMELKAVANKPAKGIVVESSLDKGKGPVATVLVKSGTLKKGDMVLSGEQFGRARRMLNELGQEVEEAGPSIPVVIQGLSGVPIAGEEFLVVQNEKLAKSAAAERKAHERDVRLKAQQVAKLEEMMSSMGQTKEKLIVNLLIKADVQGSVEALKESLTSLGNDDVEVRAISTGVGGITNADAQLALSANAMIIGFNVRADKPAREVIKQNDLDLHYYSIIYEAIDNVKAAITGFLGTETKEVIIGNAEVKDVFRSSKFGAIAGCIVLEGSVKRDNPIRVLRDNVVIFQGELESLRRHKDDVKEVRAGTECGIGVKGYDDIQPGDEIECYERVEVKKTLD